MYTVMQIRFKRPTKSLTYATREEDLKHFNVDSGEEIPSANEQETKRVLVVFISTFVIMVAGFIPFKDLGIKFFGNLQRISP